MEDTMKPLKFVIYGAFCAALLLCGTAMAAATLKTESWGVQQPLAFLDDGRIVVVTGTNTVPNNCPPATRPDQLQGCSPLKIETEYLAAGTPNNMGPNLPVDFLNKTFLINHAGKVIYWTQTASVPSDYSVLDINSGVSTPFASESPPPCNYWLKFSDSGALIGFCGSTGNLTVWSASSTQSIAPPSGYLGLNFVAVNTPGQIALNGVVSAAGSTRAMVWSVATGVKILPIPLISSIFGYVTSEAVAIDEAGDILGNLVKSDGSRLAVIWQRGSPKTIGTLPGYRNSFALGMSSRGLVLACANNETTTNTSPDTTKLFLWNKGVKQNWSSSVVAVGGTLVPSACGGFLGFGPYDYLNASLANRSGQLIYQYVGSAFGGGTPSDTFLISPLK